MKKLTPEKDEASTTVRMLLNYCRNVKRIVNTQRPMGRKKAAAVVRELRLVYRQACCGAGPSGINGVYDDYMPTLDEAEICLAMANAIESKQGFVMSTRYSLSTAEWDSVEVAGRKRKP